MDIDTRQVLSRTCTFGMTLLSNRGKKSRSTILFSNPYLSAKYVEPLIFNFNSFNAYYSFDTPIGTYFQTK